MLTTFFILYTAYYILNNFTQVYVYLANVSMYSLLSARKNIPSTYKTKVPDMKPTVNNR